MVSTSRHRIPCDFPVPKALSTASFTANRPASLSASRTLLLAYPASTSVNTRRTNRSRYRSRRSFTLPTSTMSTPMPTIIGFCAGRAVREPSRGVDQVAHPPGRLPQTHEHRSRDDAVSDVELLELRKREDRDDVPQVEPVPGEHPKPDVAAVRGGNTDLLELPTEPAGPERVAVGPRMDLDRVGPRLLRRAHLTQVGADEEADENPRLPPAAHGFVKRLPLGQDVEAPLGRDLLPFLRQ